ncbi:Tensin-1 [Clonorchis sinensis]|uniref:Tensin-1 n=1 Tax=Clonorchis sinensis TaxID=79923 RepID=A0A8T1LVS9_CLOSI|nr:Tensin-1 [Clonorchis sinensis]
MPKSVQLTNLNPNSDYPICRFQVVEHSEDKKQLPNGKPNGGLDVHADGSHEFSSTSRVSGPSVQQTIWNMHQRATELLNRLTERRQKRFSTRQQGDVYSSLSSFKTHKTAAVPRSNTQTHYYLDSGGSVHGPMDQKHSTRLGNISRSGHLIPGSRYYLGDTGARNRLFRRQSEGGIWETHSESNFRGRTLSESRRPYAFERSANERSSFRHYSYSQPSAHYRTTASHHISSGLSPGPMSHISRWSSVQGAGSHGLWRGSSGSRYATTLTRQHIKRQRDPVEMVVKAPPSMGASKIDLVSIENRPMASPQPPYSPNAFSYSHYETDSNTDRIRRLQDELSSTRRELQELKRSCSLTGDQHLLSPTAGKQNVKSTSTQYLNESSWTTHTLRKNEGMPCGARITTTPYRATSQTNLAGRTTLGQQPWSSELNIRTSTSYKNTPGISTYSAHRENLMRREDQRRAVDDGTSRQYSSRCYDESKGTGTAEILEEMETITLQPIGRGVHDLEPVRSIARSYRANTPTASRAYTPGPDTSDGYRTIATTNVQREIHSPGTHSPFIGTRYNSLYEARASENHFVSNAFPEQQWRAHTVPPNYAASTSGASGIGDSTDWEQGLMKLVRETYRDWYMPDKKREDIHFLLRDREPGAFIIRNSVSCVNSFSLGVKSPPPGPLVSANPEYMKSGPVKHFMIQTIPMPDGRTEGVQLRGFEDQPIFPGLVQFVHHHCLHPGPLPCQLRLPVTSPNNHARMGTGYFGSLTKYGQSNSTTAGGSGTTLHMLYLGSVNVDRLENEAAVRRAITHILTQSAINVNKLTKRCEAMVVVNPQDGIRIHDRAKRGLLEKHIKPNQIVFCGLDPESRLYTDPELRTRGMIHARTVGLVVRKKQFWMHGNLVYVLTEIDPTQPALNLVQYVNQVFLS